MYGRPRSNNIDSSSLYVVKVVNPDLLKYRANGMQDDKIISKSAIRKNALHFSTYQTNTI